MTQIYIVDDHPFLRQMLCEFLELQGDMAVCGEAATAEEALAGLPERLSERLPERLDGTAPDLVLIDVSLPDMNGIELARALRARYPDLPLAMLSGHGERSYVDGALEAGACGYILKGDSGEIPAAIRQMMRGEVYLSATLKRS